MSHSETYISSLAALSIACLKVQTDMVLMPSNFSMGEEDFEWSSRLSHRISSTLCKVYHEKQPRSVLREFGISSAHSY